MAPPRVPVTDPVEYLINRKFPTYRAIRASTGYGASQSPERRQALQGQVDEYRRELLAMPKEALADLFALEAEKEKGEWRLRIEKQELAQFYNRRDAMADFDHWAGMAVWTLDEGTALVLGRDPKKVNWGNLPINESSPFAMRYSNLRDIVIRGRTAGLLKDPMAPGPFLAYVERCGYEIPVDLAAALKTKGVVIADWKTLHDAAKAEAARLAVEVARLTEEVARGDLTRKELEQRVQELTTKLSDWEFDPKSDTYPPELDIAMQAWAANSRSPNPPANPREAVDRWLRSNFTDLSDAARERISITCNWNKLGGRGRPKKQKKN